MDISEAGSSSSSSSCGLKDCFLCGRSQCDKTCALCGLWFCSRAHQRLHQDQEGKCYPFQIRTKSGIGRYLVATRNIEPGEIVFREEPIIIGNNHETQPVCLGCLQPLTPENSQPCQNCGIPLCKNISQCTHRYVHLELECKTFTHEASLASGVIAAELTKSIDLRLTDPHPFYQCIAPLRGILLKEIDPEKWATIQAMVDHVQDRRHQAHWEEVQHNVVRYLRDTCQLAQRFSEEEINHVLGVLEVNAFEITLGDGQYRGRGLYPLTALMSHSCLSNTRYIFKGDNFTAECRTNVAVHQGEELVDHYVTPLNGTRWRRKKLKDGWYFNCSCLRCEDATEFGTNLSSILCEKCQGTMLYDRSLENQSGLTCQSCGAQKSNDEISQLEFDLEAYLENIKTDQNLLQETLSMHSSILHPTHYLMVAMKRYLMYLLDKSSLERIKLGTELLKVYDVITPGLTKERGLTSFEIHSGLLRRIKCELLHPVEPDQCQKLLEQCRQSLEYGLQAQKCLQFERENSFENMIFELLRKSNPHCENIKQCLINSLQNHK